MNHICSGVIGKEDTSGNDQGIAGGKDNKKTCTRRAIKTELRHKADMEKKVSVKKQEPKL